MKSDGWSDPISSSPNDCRSSEPPNQAETGDVIVVSDVDVCSQETAAPASPVVELSPERRKALEECQERLGYEFLNPNFLVAALTHASCAGSRVTSNERLEFLGDSVLGLVVCEHLYATHPELLEGELTKIKSVVVSRSTCAKVAQTLELQRYLNLGKGMTQAGIPRSVLADCFESLIAAIYLDGGLERAKAFILRHLKDEIEQSTDGEGGNWKSQFQQLMQRDHGATPIYETLRESGPDHAKMFLVSALVKSRRFASAWGRNKKEAEQRAACNALCEMENKVVPYSEEEPTLSE
jgi:ribonuclease-3